jgi:hypothetical protein
MVALRIWVLRCSAAKAFPGLVAVGIALVGSRHGWQLDWRWAVDWAPATSYLVAPVAGALVAFDRSRRMQPSLAGLGRTAPRGATSLVALVLANWAWVVLSWLVSVGYVMVAAQRAQAVAAPDVWSLAITPAVLLAACCQPWPRLQPSVPCCTSCPWDCRCHPCWFPRPPPGRGSGWR